MARRKNKRSKGSIVPLLIVIIISVLMLPSIKDSPTQNTASNNFTNGNSVYVHFIDVGQGSATLIQQGTKGIIIDAGEREYGETVVNYMQDCGIKEVVLAVASHPHSDHIGGLDEVLDAFPAGEILMPELTYDNTPTTKVYEELLTAVDDNDITVTFVDEETFYCNLTNDVELITCGPMEQSNNLNDMSVMCYVNCFDTTFFIPGDAEEDELESAYEVSDIYDLGADVMAMPHHGSSTSIYEPFLDAVDADVAVISCGKDNSYGHPHDEIMDYIEANGMTSFRTDEKGDIVFEVTEKGYSLVK